ncbi:MAG: ribonuclease III [Candidatus Shapirobacteria bacterium]|nr:ribonuclease III [Candidatus Shapirobacteria bacterium]
MDFESLEQKLTIKFSNQQLLKEALTHRSYLNEFKKEHLESNERLEFLGDVVLSFVVSNWLFEKFPLFPEGKLTNLRSNLVKTTALSEIAQNLKIGDYLLLSRGEKESGGQKNPTLLANTTEAIIGAIFLDQGIKIVDNFIKINFEPLLKKTIASGRLKDYKSLLQEKIQAKTGQSPIYKTTREEGPEHDKIFTIDVFANGKIMAKGVGKSKQKAEQEAAKIALEKLGIKK